LPYFCAALFCSRTVADPSSSVAALRLELKESCELQAKQEELIATLKDETAILNDLELELKDTRKRCKELQKLNEEQKALVNMLKKVSFYSLYVIRFKSNTQ